MSTRSEGPDRADLEPTSQAEDREFDIALRPRSFDEYVGQTNTTDNLKVYVTAARERGDPLDHTLLCGPPGLGKTTLARIIASELGSAIHVTGGPAIERKADMAGILTGLAAGDVLFIDEIHRLNAAVEENLYPAMEEFRFDFVVGEGPHAKSLKLPLQPFTLVGATTRTGLLTSPLRDRFGIVERLDYYEPGELKQIGLRSARLLGVALSEDAAEEIGRRSRGTPRVANRLLKRVRDFAQVDRVDVVDRKAVSQALKKLGYDEHGLDWFDRKVLTTVIDKFGGGPVGLDTLAAAVGEESHTLEDVVEPYLLREGFINRTPRGRVATERAFLHLDRSPGTGGGGQRRLF